MEVFGSMLFIAFTLLPTFLLWIYINKYDKNKEPTGVLVKLFFGGVLSAIATIIISSIVEGFIPDFSDYVVNIDVAGFLYVFFGIAFIEEISKLTMIYLLGWKDKNLDETYDVALYSMLVALGFATFENILYCMEGDFGTAIVRLFTAVPGHVIDGAFMGYFLYKARTTKRKKYFFLALMVPSLTHALYDFLCYDETDLGFLLFIILVIVEFIVAIKLIKNLSKNNRPLFERKASFCSNCGSPISTKYCINCGKLNENQKNVDI